jgi:hypothetical protein
MGAVSASVITSADEALALVQAGPAYLAAADATAMGAAQRVRCLRELEQADAVATAARTSVLSVFAAGQDYADDPGTDFDDRSVTLATTLGGAGVIHGDLTPECAEFVQTVLDALSAPTGADDDRTHEQRYHDGLQEAMRRLIAAGLAPRQGGQPIRVWAYVSLADLMQLEGSAELAAEWMSRLAAQWAGRRAAAAEAGGHQGLWLDGAAAQGIACGVPVTPVVTGNVNPAAFDDLIRLCAQLDKLLHAPGEHQPGQDQPGQDDAADPGADATADPDPDATAAAAEGSVLSREALAQAIIGQAVELLSGPGGLASLLRRQAGLRMGGPSLPLDIGYSETVPAHIRNAVRLRRGYCEWAGGCNQPAAACQVHHVKHKADGGPTSLTGCVLLCAYHHQVMIHRRGWTLIVNPDGTTTAWNKDRTKVLHSHGPPARAG